MNIKHFLFAGLMAAMSLASCSDYMEDKSPNVPGSLKIEVADAGLGTTRAVYSGYTTTFENGDQIGLYAVKGNRIVTNNACFTYDGSEWTTSSIVEYNDGYTYYAYYPYVAAPYSPDFSASGVDAIFDDYIDDASNKFHQQNQSTKANYQASDLMIAQGADAGSNTVSFAMLHKKGLAVFDGEGALEATFSGDNKPYTHSSKRFFLMKPSTATEFTDDDAGTYSLSASAGKYVTHNIAESYTNYFLTVTAPTAFTYAGGTNAYSIQSYKENSAGTKQKAAAWTATYDTDGDGVFDDAQPSWLTAFTASGDGSTAATNYNATVSAQTVSVSSGTASSILAGATEVGTSSDYYDLSTNGGTTSMTTANCYMVHAPGYYKLPLVYGNAIKNGTDNQTAYKPGTVSNGLANFINHAGTAISAPWITKSGTGVNGGMGITVNGAQLIWQDVNNLTTDYAIDGDYLKFKVSASSIAEGNAVIAVKNGSTIVWSWHIWVTPETFANLTTVATGSHNYRVTPVNLGWVGSGSITKTGYAGRSCTVKISQLGGQEQTFNVTQTENVTVTSVKGGNSPFYQWGRKDAFPPSNGSGNTDKTVYVGTGVDSKGWAYSNTSVGIGTNIQKPWIHYYDSSTPTYGPVNTTYYNMWDAQNATTGNITTATKKTIYDPCPPGFCVPTGNLWYYFGNGGSRTNSTWDSTNKGATWNTGITGDALWLPASGYRNGSSGSLNYVGSYGYYWSASPSSSYSGHLLYFTSGDWGWSSYRRAYGFPVRAVAEE